MSRYVVPPLPRVTHTPGSQGARVVLTRWLTSLSAIGILLVWWADERAGMNSHWASVTVPMVAMVRRAAMLKPAMPGPPYSMLKPVWSPNCAHRCKNTSLVVTPGCNTPCKS